MTEETKQDMLQRVRAFLHEKLFICEYVDEVCLDTYAQENNFAYDYDVEEVARELISSSSNIYIVKSYEYSKILFKEGDIEPYTEWLMDTFGDYEDITEHAEYENKTLDGIAITMTHFSAKDGEISVECISKITYNDLLMRALQWERLDRTFFG